HLVADHLRSPTQRPKQGVFIVGSPTTQHNAVNTEGRHSQKEEQADIQVGNEYTRRKRNDHKAHEYCGGNDGWRHHEYFLIRKWRYPVFLKKELNGIGD